MTQRDRWARRPCVLRYYEYKDKIVDAIPWEHDDKSVKIRTVKSTFFFKPPKSWSRKKMREILADGLHRQKPDIDNLLKGVLDSLVADDSSVCCIKADKLWSEVPRTVIQVEYEIDEK